MQAIAAGADMVIAQGTEAGGHVQGMQSLLKLLPELRASVEVPIIAAGGIADAAAAKAAVSAGADCCGVWSRVSRCAACRRTSALPRPGPGSRRYGYRSDDDLRHRLVERERRTADKEHPRRDRPHGPLRGNLRLPRQSHRTCGRHCAQDRQRSHLPAGSSPPVSSHSRQTHSPAAGSSALSAAGTIVTPQVGQIGGCSSFTLEVVARSDRNVRTAGLCSRPLHRRRKVR
jgi:hypothetical protein